LLKGEERGRKKKGRKDPKSQKKKVLRKEKHCCQNSEKLRGRARKLPEAQRQELGETLKRSKGGRSLLLKIASTGLKGGGTGGRARMLRLLVCTESG